MFECLREPAEGCVFTIATPTHAIAAYVKNGQFHAYDPNHNEIDIREHGRLVRQPKPPAPPIPEGLANLLAQIFHKEPREPLALVFSIYSAPEGADAQQRAFPDKAKLIDSLASPKSKAESESNSEPRLNPLNRAARVDGRYFNSLAMAALQDDQELVELLLRHGAEDPELALKLAARDNREAVLKLLLSEQYRALYKTEKERAETFREACKIALTAGRKDAFDYLFQVRPIPRRNF